MIRDRFHDFGGSQFVADVAFNPVHCWGGDMVGTIPDQCAAIIPGKSIRLDDGTGPWQFRPLTLLGARIGGMFGGAQSQNIALTRNFTTGQMEAVAPHDVAARMNSLMLQEIDTEAYLTVAYADLDLTTGRLVIVQAGHPHPVIQRQDGTIEFIGEGGASHRPDRRRDLYQFRSRIAARRSAVLVF